jgi:hypothetical protein
VSREIRAILVALFERAGLAPAAKGALAVLRWPEFVGPEIAAHTRPEGVQRGILTVATDSNVWATELSTYIPVLLERIGLALGDGVVTGIRFRVRPRLGGAGPSRFAEEEDGRRPKWPDRRDLAAIPLSREDQERLQHFTAGIKDPELAAAAGRWLSLTLKARAWLHKAPGRPGA